MIGLDTNILVRVFVRDDDVRQTGAALALLGGLTSASPGFVSLIVLVELSWVLERTYGYSHEVMLSTIDTLLNSENIQVERSELVELTLHTVRQQDADFADTLIALSATESGASKTMTFDKRAARRIPGMELLA
jgi:predicted nucleic-acid-binding protein